MKQHAPKKLATLCALIGAGISCMGVALAEDGSLTDPSLLLLADANRGLGPVRSTTVAASSTAGCALPALADALAISNYVAVCSEDSSEQLRNTSAALLPADGADIASKMPLLPYDDDQLEKFWLALRERETVPPTLPQDDGFRSVDTILLKQEADERKSAGLTEVPPLSLLELPAPDGELRLVMSEFLAVIDGRGPQPDYSAGTQWFASADYAGLPATESASQDNAADAINQTLNALSERRSNQFALDTHDATEPWAASENGDALLRTASNVSVPLVQSKASPGNLAHLLPAADLVRPENGTAQSERAAEANLNRSAQSPAHEWLAVSDNSLDGMRGGFDNGAGLMVSFGIERAVYINGNLTTSISFNIPDVSKLAADQARIIADQTKLAMDQARVVAEQAKVAAHQGRLTAEQARLTAAQAAAPAAVHQAAAPAAVHQAVAPAVAPVVAPVAVHQAVAPAAVQAAAPAAVHQAVAPAAAPVVAPVAAHQAVVPATAPVVASAGPAGLSEQVRISSEQAKISSEQARLTSEQAKINSELARLNSEQAKISSVVGSKVNLVQNGSGNTFQPGPLPQTVAATVIQNTLNNQSIKSLTVINTTVNSLSVLKGLNAQAALRDALGNSLGIR